MGLVATSALGASLVSCPSSVPVTTASSLGEILWADSQRISIAANAYHRFVLDAEARLFESPKLKAVICNSHMVAEDVRRHFSIDRSKLHVIYNAVDPDDFGPQVRANRPKMRALLGLDGSHFAFLLVGSGYHRKGVPTAIRALARLPNQARLIVVGHEKFMARYRMLASKAGVGARVILRHL